MRKLALFEQPGARVMALLPAGNLATTQSVVTLLQQWQGGGGPQDLHAAITMFDAARMRRTLPQRRSDATGKGG